MFVLAGDFEGVKNFTADTATYETIGNIYLYFSYSESGIAMWTMCLHKKLIDIFVTRD